MVLQVKTSAYEAKTQEIAKVLLGATQKNRNFFSALRDQMRWDDRILAWAMSNPGLRVQLFRFIDTLPALHSKSEIAAHLQEYLGDETVELPSALKGMLNFANPDSMPGQVAATTVATAVETLAHRYIAGENIKQVLKTIERLRKDKMAFTVDLLGEAVITEAEAQSYLERYLDLMQQLAEAAKNWATVPLIDQADGEPLPKVQVSVKLTAFYSQFDSLDPQGSEARVSDRIRILLRRAKELGVAVHFDMEQYEYKDLIFNILKKLLLLEEEFRTRTDIGMTIQAYLRDSEQDAKALIDWAKERGYPMTIRLVKGAYWDQETIKAEQKHWPQPVYNDKAATDANFENITQLLLENHQYVYAAIGSHNVRSQAHAIAIAQSLKVPSRCFEMQVLYGMGDKLAKALVDQGYRVRVYCPYGELLPGMAYLIRRLLENTANSSFLRQNLENRPVEELLAPPTFKQEDKEKVARGDGRRELLATDTDDKVARGEGRREFRTLEENGKTAVKFVGAADTDYAEEESRKESQQALQTVRQQLGKTYLPLINGEYVNTQEMINSVNPSNYTEVVGKIGLSSVEQAEQAMQAAKAAFPSWRKTPVQQRAGILYKAADLMEQRRAELAAWIVLEVGKPVREADAEVSEAIDFCRYYAVEMERLEQGYNYDVAGETNRYIYQPRGIAVVISPWNFPLAIATGMTVAALVAGNCTLLKPAETSSVIAAKLTEVLVDAGIPKGVFQYVPGKGSQVGAYLVNHIDTHVIAFTGSQEVGCRIYAEAANLKSGQKHMKRVIAEMGGKNAIIVDESADLDQAVIGVVQSAFGYSGQKCSACSRVIVHTAIYDSFVRRFTEATKSLNIGAAELPGTKVGPVIDANARDRIREYIEKGKAEAKVALEMPAPENGYFIGPVIFTDVSPNAVIAQQEIFGPVVAVIKANNFQEALSIANSTNYALTGGLYSRTPSHIQKAQEDFEVGNLYINRTITGAIVARQPFGGFKLSGVGSKAGGPDYLLQFLEPRTITENIQRQGFAPIEGAE
ncbi:L-glutamate gamma-semialdehyde dehydrogenase [Fischerella thermalis]|uniref:L-glutamate gamma-semialdehyde dehydrogenase n=1 Tax=Fischerella thermalis TaxID=372787 RepID=UPI001A08F4DF|nr:L-glutamate gamma-semialdehyde dehydrogenase [Fischerella thermalis]MBF1988640.1 L-glutamate gamma-semialdehyde dehydrogenase [Fischerella thermalis M58_A2018_009]MBF2062481.1 L-glutamate gamma-semialdehyde dehydrogenase [Fischerella thermalis M66_A2018_004]